MNAGRIEAGYPGNLTGGPWRRFLGLGGACLGDPPCGFDASDQFVAGGGCARALPSLSESNRPLADLADMRPDLAAFLASSGYVRFSLL
jgi:hypothetical protein